MNDQRTTWQRVALSDTDGSSDLLIEVVVAGGRETVGLADRIPFDQVTSVIGEVARSVGKSLESCAPTKAVVELGMEFGLQEGKLVGLIARGSAKANLKITLEWDRTKGKG